MSNACWHIWEIIHINTLSLNTNLWWYESSNTTTLARFVKNIFKFKFNIAAMVFFFNYFNRISLHSDYGILRMDSGVSNGN